MNQHLRDQLIEHLIAYLKTYTDRGCTDEAAALNYVREFPARLPRLILALMEKPK